MTSVTRPSLPMRMNAFGAKTEGFPFAAAARPRAPASRCHPNSNPPPAAAPAVRNPRRDTRAMSASLVGGGRRLRCLLDGLADPRIRAAAADVPRHRLIDIGIRGRWYLREQRSGGHDLSGLAVAALHDLQIEPGLLHLLAFRRLADGLDGGDRMPDGSAHRHHASPPRASVEVHGAGAAERDATAELGAVHAEQGAQDPQAAHIR